MEGSEKLLRLKVDVGDKNEAGESVNRQIISGIGKIYNSEDLIGKEVVIVANLEPRTLIGLESRGMILAAGDENNLALIVPDKEITPGFEIK